ncbi:diguanylate cyclase domain-containing protein [Marinomonas atlantica]|uniref:diguanylate cyclase domain-containing protein n=1 Tax=Marinomonas atlantica TaxID=1806668 RepID=UPI0009ED2812|nr:diguanylate cyclase [Marinomonas atlantica]
MLRIFKQHSQKTFIAFTVVFWISSALMIRFYAELNTNRAAQEEKQNLRRETALIRSKIESTIYEDVYIAGSLATVLRVSTNTVIDNWENIASDLLKKSSNIRNIGVAPNNVLSLIYPLKGNEAAVGLDFRSIPEQYAALMKAKETGDVYLDGPIELVQGGQALIARYPIFLDYPTNQNYWGSASIVLNFADILHESNLNDFDNASFAIKRTTVGGDVEVFFGAADTFISPDELLPIFLPNNQWLLAAKSTSGLSDHAKFERKITQLFGYTGALILYISVFLLYRAYQLAHNASLKDELTQIPNRRYLFSQLEHRMKPSKRNKGFALLNIDLNAFKQVNDRFGHEAGDKLLKHIAQLTTNKLKGTDFVARVGGDEFLIVLDSIDAESTANERADYLKQHIENKPLDWKGGAIKTSISVGVVVYSPDQPTTQEELLHAADYSMYKQKEAHKNNNQIPDDQLSYII